MFAFILYCLFLSLALSTVVFTSEKLSLCLTILAVLVFSFSIGEALNHASAPHALAVHCSLPTLIAGIFIQIKSFIKNRKNKQ